MKKGSSAEAICDRVEARKNFECHNLKGFCDRILKFCRLCDTGGRSI
ncbi:hypothetical protein QUB60_27700 [Microcoleus sp. A2-C5]|nr:hypothetical protein [Lyngbya sp. CCAP 1446/10]MCW6052683.1 hypothetical protein [Lyngbya sp. CCAP 1446/10]